MFDPTKELRVRAERLQRDLARPGVSTLKRLRRLPEYRRAGDDTLVAAAQTIQRKHCLAIVAREAGFSSWEHALRVIRSDETESDYGDLLYRNEWSAFLNHWFARYEDALHLRQTNGGYLLAYRRQYLVVAREYISTLGLDPDHGDWRAIGWNWPRPNDAAARQRLYAELLANMPRGGALI